MNPVSHAIELIMSKGRVARLYVDCRRNDVLIPVFWRHHREHLIIDLNPADPLNVERYAHALCADLASNGHVERCTLPWAAIFAVVDRESGDGLAFKMNEPAEVLAPELQWRDADAEAKARRSRFGVIEGGKA